MKALIDGDVLAYRCGFAAEKAYYLHGDTTYRTVTQMKEAGLDPEEAELIVEPEPVENALHNVKHQIELCLENTGADTALLCLSDQSGTFRDQIATVREYKGNRDRSRKPYHFGAILDYMKDVWTAEEAEDQEADDLLGIYQSHAGDLDTVVCTSDKDLQMISGLHYHLLTGKCSVVTPWEADLFFYRQLLTGDTTDNIVGLPGYGPAAAKRITVRAATANPKDQAGAIHKAIEREYRKVYKDDWENMLLEMGRLLWIRRDYGQMWKPWICTTQ